MVQIACQTIVFGNPVIKDTIADIFKTIAEIGYNGAEVGGRHFYMDRPDYYIELLEKNHLQLPAIHMGGDFLDKNSVNDQLKNFEKTVEFAKKLGCRYIYLSGAHQANKSIKNYQDEAVIYNDMGKYCRESGLKLCYHNHDWEMLNRQFGIKLLLEETNPENLYMVPDVGWMTVANTDPAAFIEKYIDRIEALHFKDFKPVRQFTELGTGMVDFKKIYDVFAAHRKDFWITAEQDSTELGGPESAKLNYNFINNMRTIK